MTQEEIASRFLAAQAVAREAGLLALRLSADRQSLDVQLKGPQDFVSAADRASEQLIAARLSCAFPQDGFLGEESHSATTVPDPAKPLWVADPIDGTANFVQGRSEWCVSLGLLLAGRPEIGVIYHPAADALYAARRGHGASRNGQPIRVSGRDSLVNATVGLDYSPRTPASDHLGHIAAVLQRGGEYRRSGSCTASLTQVADGRLDGFAELDLSIWDVLAGMVLVSEAGGWTSDFLADGGLARGAPFVAATPAIRDELLAATGLERLLR